MSGPQMNIIERAYEMARSGRYKSLPELRLALRKEGYAKVTAYTQGQAIKAELAALIAGAS